MSPPHLLAQVHSSFCAQAFIDRLPWAAVIGAGVDPQTRSPAILNLVRCDQAKKIASYPIKQCMVTKVRHHAQRRRGLRGSVAEHDP
jgi:hypothetical protein